MEQKIIWQQESSNPENLNNLAIIREWWTNLNYKEITLAQRVISSSGEVSELDWEAQRFDEVFVIKIQTFVASLFIGVNLIFQNAIPHHAHFY